MKPSEGIRRMKAGGMNLVNGKVDMKDDDSFMSREITIGEKEFAMINAKDFIIFRAGDYPQGKYTEKDLDEMVETFNADDPPHIIIGHSSDYKGRTRIPSFGQIFGGLKRIGRDLVATGAEFNEKLAEWIRQGFYTRRSIELSEENGKKKILALGMLGACPPAVKGLPSMDEALEEIAMQFSDDSTFKEIEFADVIEFDTLDEAEKIGKDDTIYAISELLARLDDALEDMIKRDERDERIKQEIMEYMNDLMKTLDIHAGFMAKMELLEANAETEMSDSNTKKSWLDKAKELFTTRKDVDDMDTKREQELLGQLAEKDAKLKEFADAQAAADKAKVDADAAAAESELKAQDAALRAEIKVFLAENGKNLKIVDELNLPEMMFQLAKAPGAVEFKEGEATVSKSLIDVFKTLVKTIPAVPLGESKEFQNVEKKDEDTRMKVVRDAEKYVEAHKKEFDGMSKEQATGRAIYLHSCGEIKFQ